MSAATGPISSPSIGCQHTEDPNLPTASSSTSTETLASRALSAATGHSAGSALTAATNESRAASAISQQVAQTSTSVHAAMLDAAQNDRPSNPLPPAARAKPAVVLSKPTREEAVQASKNLPSLTFSVFESANSLFDVIFKRDKPERDRGPSLDAYKQALDKATLEVIVEAQIHAINGIEKAKQALEFVRITLYGVTGTPPQDALPAITKAVSKLNIAERLLNSKTDAVAVSLRKAANAIDCALATVNDITLLILNQTNGSGSGTSQIDIGMLMSMSSSGEGAEGEGVDLQRLNAEPEIVAPPPSSAPSSTSDQPPVPAPAPANASSLESRNVPAAAKAKSVALRIAAVAAFVGLVTAAIFGKIVVPTIVVKMERPGYFLTTQVVVLSPLLRGIVGCTAVGLLLLR